MSEPIHILRPSVPRRAIAFAIQMVLGTLLLWLAFAHPPESLFLRLFLVILGIGALFLGSWGWQASAQAIELHEDGLRGEDGTWIAPLSNIRSVDRGLFAFKPSNGFILRLHDPMERAWAPGMWWRMGRRVGVGGVTSGADAKIAADALAVMVERKS
ncbi:hypothetical protein [Jannaschia aquimarina]|uniref:PH domain-containing protein n=1 Tax=Jannaschia aquimarina TaxID=935700 RepID=A0A0D1D6B7_9RHOB|nr:hypothetical protein [Jannaschia aquimarina]KIT15538.1 hypothetical protein jaqu_27860 [Jannaschia aquimarina]SNT34726.1 hypothetical protein SAMN05421775_11267 [Jannaschia aquimarina]